MKFGLEKWIIIATVVTVATLQMIDTSIVNVTLLQMMGSLGATLGDISWVITSYAAANVIMIAMAGWLSARFGRRNYFVASIILFTAASMLCGMSANVWMLVLFRFIQGLGGGGLLSTSQAILVETFPKKELGLASAVYGLGVIIGPTIGPTLGGVITDHLSWHWVFFVNVPVGVLAATMSFLYIREPRDRAAAGAMDWPGLGFLVAGVGALQVVLERGNQEGWFESKMISVLAVVSVIGVAGFIWRELTCAFPLVNLRLLKDRRFGIGSLFNFILGFGLYSSVFVIPIFAQNFLGFTATDTGMLLIPGSLATAVMMPFIGKALHKNGPARLFSGTGFFLFFLFTVLLAHLSASSGREDFLWPLMIRGTGLGLIFIPLTTITLVGLKGRDIPQGTGLINMIRQLGGSFGVALMATFIERRTVFHRGILSAFVTPYDPGVQQRMAGITGALISRGVGAGPAHQKALALLDLTVGRQAALLSYLDAFYGVGIFFLLCIPLLFLFGKSKESGGGASHAAMAVE